MAFQINYLTKEELIYELRFRNVQFKPEHGVDLLRKQLRQHLDVPVSLNNLKGKLSIIPEIDLVQTKYSVLLNLLEDVNDSDNPLVYAKLNARIAHLCTRISNLNNCVMNDELKQKVSQLASGLKELNSKFLNIKSKISEDEMSKFEEILNKSLTEEEDLTQQLTNVGLPLNEMAEINQGDLGASTPKFNPENQLDSPNAPVNIPLNIATNYIPNVPHSSVYNHGLFNKLPNPLEKYMNNFQITDGLDVNLLLLFLRNLVKIETETKLTSQEIYEILPSYCEGPLLCKIIESKQAGLPIELFHADLLNSFIPSTLKPRLCQDLIFRPQMYGEPLAVYINEIKIHHQVLRSQLTESELVTIIKNGISPEVRNKLVFESNPTCFKDLNDLCLQYNNVGYNDWIRENMRGATNQPNRECHNVNFGRANNRTPRVRSDNSRPVCYRCNKTGHIARQCYSNPKN